MHLSADFIFFLFVEVWNKCIIALTNFLLGAELSRQLESWLHQADLSHGPARAIIAP